MPVRSPSFSAALLLALLSTAAHAQYGDAYHAPDRLRLQQMASQRASQMRDEHYARLRATAAKPVPAPLAGLGGSSSNVWADTSGTQAQREAAARQDARLSAYDAKLQRMDALIAERGLRRRPEDYEGIMRAATDAGLDLYWAQRTIGTSRADYAARLARQSGGSSNSRSQPDGPGTVALPDGGRISGTWAGGKLTGTIKLAYANGDLYEGGFDGQQFSGPGRYTFKNGSYDSGTYLAGKLDGPAERVVVGDGVREVTKGSYKAGMPVGVHETLFEGGKRKRLVENFDKPEDSRLEFTDGKVFAGFAKDGVPVDGLLTYANGATFRGLFHDNGAPRVGLYTGNSGSTQYGWWNDRAKNNGYAAMTYSDGSAAEIMHDNGNWSGPVLRTLRNGDVLTGTTARSGFRVWGMLQPKGASPGAARPAGVTEAGDLVNLPEADAGAAREAALAAAQVIEAERAKLRALLGA